MRTTHDPERSAAALDELRSASGTGAGGTRSSGNWAGGGRDEGGGTGGRRTGAGRVVADGSFLTRTRDMLERTARRLRVLPLRLVVVTGVLSIGGSIAVAALLVRSTAASGTVAPTVTVPPATTPTTTEGPGIVVQASGAVRSPGVYRLPMGSRVVDLLERSGGPAPDLDLDRVNLAALLSDGQRVWMPRTGEAAAPIVSGAGGGGTSSTPARIDVNHASVEQLDALPGIGPTLAAAVVADRERHGPFRSVDDLLRVKGLSRSKVDALRDLVVLG